MRNLTAPARLDTADILRVLAERAAAPLSEARSLPGAAYTDVGFYELELERIFGREWTCVGRSEQVAEAGDWFSVDLAGEPIMVVREGDGGLHAFSRVCPHRSMDLLNDEPAATGNQPRFVCPYHRWSFRLDGSCIGATDMGESTAFDPEQCRLAEFPLDQWQGFVFVSLDPSPPPLADRMAGLGAVLGDVDLASWRLIRTLAWGEQPCNWKIVIENGVECYHHVGTHRTTLEPVYPHASIDVTLSPDAHWVGGWMVVSEEASQGEDDGHRIHPLFFAEAAPGTTPFQRSATLIAGVFPAFFLAISPDVAIWFQWYPTGPTSHQADLHLILPPTSWNDPDRDAIVEQLADVLNAIQAEDATTNAGVQRMMTSAHAGNGPLSHLEYPIWQFQRYLADRLGA